MAGGRQRESDAAPQHLEKVSSSWLQEIVWPAVQIGGLAGATGLLFGTFAGILRSCPPILFGLLSSIQWSVLGSTYTLSRGTVTHICGEEKLTPRDKVPISAFAGAVSGATGGLLRGRWNIIPGAIVFSFFGATGQVLYNKAVLRAMQSSESNQVRKQSWVNSRWSPMKILSDHEYESMLRERVLKVDAEIALLDESIEELRALERESQQQRL